MAENYYVILGIKTDATQDEIKSAYRREAKKCHPDCSGEGSESFLLIRDAYEVLSDPMQRQAYDDKLVREKRQQQSAWQRSGSDPWMERPPIEPVTSSWRAGSARDRYRQPPIFSLFEEILRGQQRRGVEEIHAEVSLTRHLARQGGRVRISLPLQFTCPTCGGRGGDGYFQCNTCGGTGALVDEHAVDVTFPGGVYDGLTGSVPVGVPGVGHPILVLHFRVDAW